MHKTDVADKRDNVKDTVTAAGNSALDTVRSQASSAGETLGAAMSTALEGMIVEIACL